MDKANKTFIILTPGFPKDEADSTCLPFPQLFVKNLKKNNPRLNIIVLSFQYPFSDQRYSWYGVDVIPFNGRNRGKASRLLVWRKVLKELNSIHKTTEIKGVLNLWLGECALIGKYVSGKFKVPSFTWLMGQDAKIDNRYYLFIKPKAETLIALSDFLAAEFYKNYKIKPAHTIPPGIDTGEFEQDDHVRPIDMIGVGSLIALKQFDVFIRVLEKIAKQVPFVKAVICGDGPERKKLAALIEKSCLSENIELLGEIKHNEVLKLMRRSKILLHPSAYEGFATVYSEALYAGAHVVGFCRPMDQLFKHQHATSSEQEMTAIVLELLSDRQLDHSQVLVHPISETCSRILSLYTN